MDENIEEIQEVFEETVSGGDFVPYEVSAVDAQTLTVEDITVAIEAAEIEAVVTVSAGETLFTKPLDEYTVTEGLLLILVLCAVGLCISKVIGGVLNCKALFRK